MGPFRDTVPYDPRLDARHKLLGSTPIDIIPILTIPLQIDPIVGVVAAFSRSTALDCILYHVIPHPIHLAIFRCTGADVVAQQIEQIRFGVSVK